MDYKIDQLMHYKTNSMFVIEAASRVYAKSQLFILSRVKGQKSELLAGPRAFKSLVYTRVPKTRIQPGLASTVNAPNPG